MPLPGSMAFASLELEHPSAAQRRTTRLAWLLSCAGTFSAQAAVAGTEKVPLRKEVAPLQPSIRCDRIGREGRSAAGSLPASARVFAKDRFGFLWIGTESGLARYDSYNINVYTEGTESGDLSSSNITALYADPSGDLWIGTEIGDLNRLDLVTYRFSVYQPFGGHRGSGGPSITSIAPAAGGLWVGSDGAGLSRFTAASNVFEQLRHDPNDPTSLSSDEISALTVDRRGNVWVGTSAGIVDRLDARTGEVVHHRLPSGSMGEVQRYPVTVLHFDMSGALWVGTKGAGVHRLDLSTGDSTNYRHDPARATTLSHNDVTSIAEDRSGALWVGTQRYLNRFDPRTKRFATIRPIGSDNSANRHHWVTSLHLDSSDVLSVGTDGSGACSFHTLRERFHHYADQGSVGGTGSLDGTLWISVFGVGPASINRTDAVLTSYRLMRPTSWLTVLYPDRSGTIWLGDVSGDLYRFDPRKEVAERFIAEGDYDPDDLHAGPPTSMLEDERGGLWIGTWGGGLSVHDPRTDRFRHFPASPSDSRGPSSNFVYTLYRDPAIDGQVWVGTARGGVNLVNSRNGTFDRFKHPDDATDLLATADVLTIHRDSRGVLWLGTRGNGLIRFDPNRKQFRVYTETDGLAHNVVYGILSDNDGFLWISTDLGLSRLDPRTHEFFNFDATDGLQQDEFGQGTYQRLETGELVFGGPNGFNIFDPKEIELDRNVTPVTVTKIEVAGRRIPDAPTAVNSLGISFKDNSFSIEFSALSFASPEKNQYEYWLKGLNDGWMKTGALNRTTFTNLSPGLYSLQVKASNHHGTWSSPSPSIPIRIIPPPWRTWWAYTIYAFIGVAVVAVFVIATIQHGRVVVQGERIRMLEEVDDQKSVFFGNIAHELRTPLTLILGPLEHILADNLAPPGLKAQVERVTRNARRLLRLTNQVLDVLKLEAGQMKPSMVPADLDEFIEDAHTAFLAMAENRKITFTVDVPKLLGSALMDVDKIERVTFNLLSNAMKFTPEGGTVILSAHRIGGQLRVAVTDSGVGIRAEQVDNVFQRFRQIEDPNSQGAGGTGIGLWLSKQFVELHAGRISFTSEYGRGSTFLFELPLESQGSGSVGEGSETTRFVSPRTSDIGEATASSLAQHEPAVWGPNAPSSPPVGLRDVPTVLLVDDNPDLLEFLCEVCSSDFNVLSARDGVEALERMRTHNPDIVVTDVMMPRMDGEALCRAIKLDASFRDIPVILVTAKADPKTVIEGLRGDADDFVGKPFNSAELLARINNLITQRQQRLRLKEAAAELERLNADLELGSVALQASNEELRLRNRDLSDFAAIASHDIQAPLRRVHSFAGFLESNCKLDDKCSRSHLNRSSVHFSLTLRDWIGFVTQTHPSSL